MSRPSLFVVFNRFNGTTSEQIKGNNNNNNNDDDDDNSVRADKEQTQSGVRIDWCAGAAVKVPEVESSEWQDRKEPQ